MADEIKNMTPEQIRAEIDRIGLETAQLNLEAAKETNAQTKSVKMARSRQNSQRQAQLKADLQERVESIRGCTHRQGGSPGKERRGKGPSALRVVILPDESQLVMCANCPLRVFSPREADKSEKPRMKADGVMETPRDAKVRAAQYRKAREEFDKLVEHSEDQLTDEAGRPMHSGKTFRFMTGDGVQVFPPRPCDSYAQGIDNRRQP